VNRCDPLVLLSGLPLDRKPSFLRQLDSLAAVWRQQGRSVFVGGPVIPDSDYERGNASWSGEGVSELGWRLVGLGEDSLSFAGVVSRTSPGALIALGYPDQFPFLSATRLPTYLWSQFSRPPKRVLPEPPTYIPLTEKTALHLRTAGCSRIGPVIAHGVDTRLFSPLSERCSPPGTFVVGTVADNSRRKRIDLIVRSFALFCRERPRSRLLIKTNRRASLDGVDLPALIARENVGDRVEIITTELTDAEMAELYNRMDLYLNLSEWEGFCVPVIEAMACGVPVVGPPMQGPGEILPYQNTLAPEGEFREEEGTELYQADPEAVAVLLVALAGDSGLRARLSREGREAALSRYDIRRIAAQWEGVLQRI